MIATIALAVVLLVAYGTVWIIRNTYERVIAILSADNIDLRNRLFISKGQAPIGTDLNVQYEDKQVTAKTEKARIAATGRKSPAPLAKWRDRMSEKDRAQLEKGIDLTASSDKVN